ADRAGRHRARHGVNHRIPSGTRDVLPDEMRELRAITDTLRGVFELHGYGEVYTPAIEYEATLRRDHGDVQALRADMTVPIARLVATRFPTAEPPLRFCYIAHAYRQVTPHRGQMREFLQAGIELLGAPGPEGTAEALTVLCHALDAVGLEGYRVGLGDAALYPALLSGLGVDEEHRERLLQELATKDFVGLEREVRELDLAASDADLLVRVPQLRGGSDVLDAGPGPVADALRGLREVLDLLEASVAAHVIFDLGLARGLGYYTGAVFDVYDPALGAPLGGGGRYDDLLGRFGRPLPAMGFALGVDRLHAALSGEEHAGL